MGPEDPLNRRNPNQPAVNTRPRSLGCLYTASVSGRLSCSAICVLVYLFEHLVVSTKSNTRFAASWVQITLERRRPEYASYFSLVGVVFCHSRRMDSKLLAPLA